MNMKDTEYVHLFEAKLRRKLFDADFRHSDIEKIIARIDLSMTVHDRRIVECIICHNFIGVFIGARNRTDHRGDPLPFIVKGYCSFCLERAE